MPLPSLGIWWLSLGLLVHKKHKHNHTNPNMSGHVWYIIVSVCVSVLLARETPKKKHKPHQQLILWFIHWLQYPRYQIPPSIPKRTLGDSSLRLRTLRQHGNAQAPDPDPDAGGFWHLGKPFLGVASQLVTGLLLIELYLILWAVYGFYMVLHM